MYLQDPLAHLSTDMIARCYNVFSIVLKYAVDMLTWDKEDELPPGLEPPYVHACTQEVICDHMSRFCWSS